MSKTACLKWFRTVALLEGISTVILFGIAMPIKYIAGNPVPVTYVGWVHGLLFILYVGLLGFAAVKLSWRVARVLLFFVASLVPLAPFWVERSLRDEPTAP